MEKPTDITVEIIQCKSCAKLAVALNGCRVTYHKCAGLWKTVLSERVPRERIDRTVEEN